MGSTTYVSSTVYNLAGDVNKRVNYLKSTVVGAVINDSDIAQTITDSYLRGPGIKLRSFAKWARTQGYSDLVGLVTGAFYSAGSLDATVASTQVPAHIGATATVQSAEIGPADFLRWADRYMGANYPEELDTNWVAEYDPDTNLITITRTTGVQVTFLADGFDVNSNYLYVQYIYVVDPVISPVSYGGSVSGPFPSLSQPVVLQDNTVYSTVVLNNSTTSTTTYSNSTPSSTTTSSGSTSVTQTNFDRTIGDVVLVAPRTYEDRTHYMTQTGSVVSASNTSSSSTTTTSTTNGVTTSVTATTVTTVNTQSLEYSRVTRTNTVTRVLSKIEPTQTMIYAKGSGNAVLDSLFNSNGSIGTFFPYIPIRINNAFISPTYYDGLYTASKKAVRKATGGKFDKVVKSLADNAQIGDIDFAYMVFGVALNTKENECKRYLYTFFQTCAAQSNDSVTFAEWKIKNNARIAIQNAYNTRTAGTGEYSMTNGSMTFNSSTGTWSYEALPEIPEYTPPPIYGLTITSGNLPGMNYNISLTWTDMALSTGTGLARAGAKVGELWFEQLSDETIETMEYYYERDSGSSSRVGSQTLQRVALVFQESLNRWKRITILNLVHQNLVYNGKAVYITSKEALNSSEESGFIIPLHEGMFAATPLVSRTQMANSCSYLMLNSYTVVTTKWYQTGLFAIFVIIVVILVAIYYPPAASFLSSSGGILGGNVAVGSALGFTGIAAVLAGVVANAIASMFVMKIISSGATAIFGEKIGAIIGFIASVYALQAGTMMASGQQFSMATMYTNMMKAENLLKLTLSVGDGVAQYIRASAQQTMGETAKLVSDYKVKSDDITEKYEKEFGVGAGGVINPLAFTDVSLPGYEPSTVFLNRTLLTGSDIAQITLDMITKFSSLTLNLELET